MSEKPQDCILPTVNTTAMITITVDGIDGDKTTSSSRYYFAMDDRPHSYMYTIGEIAFAMTRILSEFHKLEFRNIDVPAGCDNASQPVIASG